MLRLAVSCLILCAFIVTGVQAYCCFVLELTSSLNNFPDQYLGHYVRNYTGIERINDHLFWKKVGDANIVLFWSLNKNVRLLQDF